MVKTWVVVGILTASCASAAPSFAQQRSSPQTTSNTRQVDPVRRAWIERSVSHMLADNCSRAGAR